MHFLSRKRLTGTPWMRIEKARLQRERGSVVARDVWKDDSTRRCSMFDAPAAGPVHSRSPGSLQTQALTRALEQSPKVISSVMDPGLEKRGFKPYYQNENTRSKKCFTRRVVLRDRDYYEHAPCTQSDGGSGGPLWSISDS